MHKHKKNINLGMEIKLLSGNYRSIAGIDEAGRGSWAGPIVAGIIVIKNDDLAQANKIKKNPENI